MSSHGDIKVILEKVVYFDDNYPGAWFDGNRSRKIRDFLIGRGFMEKNAKELMEWIKEKVKNKAQNSVLVFSKDIVPHELLVTGTISDLIGRYLDFGGKVIWIGDIPFWTRGFKRGARKKDREDIYNLGTPIALTNTQPLIGEVSGLSEWVKGSKWEWRKYLKGELKSRWRSQRPVFIPNLSPKPSGWRRLKFWERYKPICSLTVEPMAYAEVTLLASPYNLFAVGRLRAGRKIADIQIGVGATIANFTLGISTVEKLPKELGLKPIKLVCAYHVIYNHKYPWQGFYRSWDCMVEPTNELLEDIIRIANLGPSNNS